MELAAASGNSEAGAAGGVPATAVNVVGTYAVAVVGGTTKGDAVTGNMARSSAPGGHLSSRLGTVSVTATSSSDDAARVTTGCAPARKSLAVTSLARVLTAWPARPEAGAHMDHAPHTAEAHWVLVLNRANGAYAVPPVWASAARPYICSRKRWTSAYAKYAEAKAE